MNKSSLRRAIDKRSKEYSDEEIFSSTHFAEILQSVVQATCEKLGRIPTIHSDYAPESNHTSCTDGMEIFHNPANPITNGFETTWEKYVSNVGMVTHEVGHVLFTDFKEKNKMFDAWDHGTFYPVTPKGGKKVMDYLKSHPYFAKMFLAEMKFTDNALEDVYIENCCFQEFGGVCSAGLIKNAEEIFNQSHSEAEMFQQYLDGKITLLSIANSLILLRERGFIPRVGTLDYEMNEPYKKVYDTLSKIEDNCKKLHFESEGKERCNLINEITIKLFELLDTPEEDMDESSSSSMSENSEKEQKANGATTAPEGSSSPVEFTPDEKDTNDGKANAKALSKSESSLEDYAEKAKKDLAKEEILEEEEMKHAEDLNKEIESVAKYSPRAFENYKINRKVFVDEDMKATYNVIYSKVASTSKALVRKISSILKERKTEGYDSGYLLGQKFNPQDVYHGDGKYFSREVVPDGQPNVVFGILLDESGSMSCSNKWQTTRKAAILLEDVFRNLNIPTIIVGHDEDVDKSVRIHSYVDFDTRDDRDKYRLADVRARYNNADGCAIAYMTKKLSERNENIKVLIVISDGQPAAYSCYYKNNIQDDCYEAIKQARKKDIKVFGAIVDEFDAVSEIYGKEYSFDCREEDVLQKELLKLVKKYVLCQ